MRLRRPARLPSVLIGSVITLGLALPLAAPAPAKALSLPPGFSESAVFSGLLNPTVVRFASDGRIFVAEKSGIVKVFDSLTDTTPTTFVDLRTQVDNFWDRGLLGMALAPTFPTDPSVYLLYTYDALPGGTAPHWGTAGATSDPCPNPPGATTDGCVVTGRLSRFTANGSVAGPEQVLITDWCNQFPTHTIGNLAFGADGFLYVSAGEGANPNYADYGQAGGSTGSPTPKNPCDDPPAGSGGDEAPPTAEGGALRSQDLLTPGDPTTLDGTILRIDPATGAGAPGNPLAGSADANARRIIAHGLRNPFRFAIKPGTNELWIGDVGFATWEEIDRLPAGSGLTNFGWPCYEGNGLQPAYDAANLNLCENLYAAGPSAVGGPYFTYNHANRVVGTESCPVGSSSITGMAFGVAGSYPAQYTGALFFADYSRNCIWVMPKGANGLPDPAQVATLVDGAAAPVDLEIGPGGDLFYVDFIGGTIRRVQYGVNAAPTAVMGASPTSGASPLTVNFTSTGSSDPDGDALIYAWDLDGDGLFNDGTGATATHQYVANGTVTATLRVSDGHGGSDTDSKTITVTGGPTVTYLSTLTPTTAINGWGPYEKDMSNGEKLAGDGHPITLNGVVYAKGLGTHAVSDLIYPMPGGTCSFLASIGIDDEVPSSQPGSVTFQVFAGTTSLYLSPTLTPSSTTVNLNLAIPAGTTSLRLLVGNAGTSGYDHADWANARVSCTGGPANTPPTPVIDTPASGLTWTVGQQISFTGHATDAQDGTLAASRLSWSLLLQHCPSNCHTHDLQSWTGVASGSFAAPDHEYPSYLELKLTATDSTGLSTTVTRRLDPKTVVLSFASSTSGLQLVINATSQATPFTRTVIVGSANSFSAPTPQSLSGKNYAFNHWSDAGAATHNKVAPATATTYTATYTLTGGPVVTYLSTLTPTTAINGYGPYERDMSNGEKAARDGHTLTLNGVTYARGLGTNAISDLRYTMPGGTCSFLASIGVDDEVPTTAPAGSVTFQVFAGATSLYLSPTMGPASTTRNLTLTIPAGTTQLRLLVGNAGSSTYDHADWANARISCTGGPTVTYLSDLTPTTAINGWGPYERDRSNGEKLAGDGHWLTLNGVVFAKGLGTHAISDLRYTMPGGSCRFLAQIGVDDEVSTTSPASVTFQVFAGATSIYLSPTMGAASTTGNLNLAIPVGTTSLRLLVGNAGTGGYDHADWADARVSCT